MQLTSKEFEDIILFTAQTTARRVVEELGLKPKKIKQSEAIRRLKRTEYNKAVKRGLITEEKNVNAARNSPVWIATEQVEKVEMMLGKTFNN